MSNKELITQLEELLALTLQNTTQQNAQTSATSDNDKDNDNENDNGKDYEGQLFFIQSLLQSLYQGPDQEMYANRDLEILRGVVKTIKSIIKKINAAGHALEKEMRGVENYSDYQRQRIHHHTSQIYVKNQLEKMMKMIYRASPHLDEEVVVVPKIKMKEPIA